MKAQTRICPNSTDTLCAKPVLTKADFVRRYRAGEFGNRSPTWDTIEEYLASGYQGLVHLRNREAGGRTWYNVAADDVELQACDLISQGYRLYYSGMAPHEHNLLQGEVRQSEDHIDLTYSDLIGLPMRDALGLGVKYASGIMAVVLLQSAMDPPSYDWLQELLTLYPNHVVEFSTFSKPWGTIPNRNTVFWECRNY